MRIDVHCRNLPVTDPLREYVTKRLHRLERFFTRECSCDVELWVERNPRIAASHVAEATLVTRGHTLRARYAATDMYAAIDGLADRLRRQLADVHERETSRPRHLEHPLSRVGLADVADVAVVEDQEWQAVG